MSDAEPSVDGPGPAVAGAGDEPVSPDAQAAAQVPEVRPGERARDASTYRELLRFAPDVLRLLWDLSRDPRVSRLSKLAALAVAGYLVSPIDVLPDFLPGLGQLDDLYLAVWAVRRLVADAGYDLVREHWSGSDDGFALLLVAAGIRR